MPCGMPYEKPFLGHAYTLHWHSALVPVLKHGKSNAVWFSIPLDWCRAVFVCRLVNGRRIPVTQLADTEQPTHGTILLIILKSIMTPYPGAHISVLWLDNRWLMTEHISRRPDEQQLASPLRAMKQVVMGTVCLGMTAGVCKKKRSTISCTPSPS